MTMFSLHNFTTDVHTMFVSYFSGLFGRFALPKETLKHSLRRQMWKTKLKGAERREGGSYCVGDGCVGGGGGGGGAGGHGGR